ncbi:MAG: hypothetical protein M5R41_03605 [Bacteroidia bacterium]|nr:hypothetical protein [Bacteroidia bacterium]
MKHLLYNIAAVLLLCARPALAQDDQERMRNPWRWERTDMGVMAGFGASGMSFRTGLVYFDVTIAYKPPDFADIRHWFAKKADPDSDKGLLITGFALGGIVPMGRFGIMGGLDLHLRSSLFTEYRGAKPDIKKYSTQLHYLAGLYFIPTWCGIGLGYGTGRSFNASFVWMIGES